jgi:Zn-dependent peptidase ImmA (M78 family)
LYRELAFLSSCAGENLGMLWPHRPHRLTQSAFLTFPLPLYKISWYSLRGPVMLDDMQREDVVAVIDQMVEELLDAAGVTAPPIDAIALAQGQLGMVVCLDKRQAQRGRAQRSGGKPQIYLRPEPREERHQWTVAHEIGEHLKTELLQRLDIGPGETKAMTGESLANLFAYRLLVPKCWFDADAKALEYDLLKLKPRYRTSSHEVIAWRFLDLSEPCVVTVIDHEHISRRRSSGPRVTRELLPAEHQCQKYVNRYSRPKAVRVEGVTVHGWPVHAPDWKREILRSVFDEGFVPSAS